MQRYQIEKAEEKRKLKQSQQRARCMYCGVWFSFIPIFPGISQPFDSVICRKLYEEEAKSKSEGGDTENFD